MTRAYYCAASLRTLTRWRIKLALTKSRLWLLTATLTVSAVNQGMVNDALMCCAVPRQAKPSLGGLQNICILLQLKQYIIPYTVSCAPRQGLTADAAAFRASNGRFCFLELLQQFAIDLLCTVDYQPASGGCAVRSKSSTQFEVNAQQLSTSNNACMMLWSEPCLCRACRCSLCAMSERTQLGTCEAGRVPGPHKM